MSRIIGSLELIKGNTQEDLANQWVVQINSALDDGNPFIFDDSTDLRGRRGSLERHESFQLESPDGVSFLGGIFNGAIPAPAFRTIVGRSGVTYFAPFTNQFIDNTTEDSSLGGEFPGGYAFNQRHLDDLEALGIEPRDPSDLLGEAPGSLPTLLNVAQFIVNNFLDEQFVKIDGVDVTPDNIEEYRRETDDDLTYLELPRSTGAVYTDEFFSDLYNGNAENVIVADPDLSEDLNNEIFPTLDTINPTLENKVVPFAQVGDYFGFELSPGSHLVEFGATNRFGGPQNVTYNILNPITGTDGIDVLKGTEQGDYIEGLAGKDVLLGRDGDDLLVGGNDSDILAGGKQDDELWGGQGSDLFVYFKNYGKDKIFDFEKDEVIKVFGLDRVDAEPVMSNERNSTQFDFGGGDILTIVGVTPEELVFTPNFFGGAITFD